MQNSISIIIFAVQNLHFVHSSNSFVKTISLTDLDYPQLFMPIQTFDSISSVIVCGAVTSLHAKEKKASGFVYHNGTCTIGRVHPFGNPFSPQKLAMTKYTDGVHVYEGKGCFANVSLLPRDLYGLFIINDDLFFNVPGYNFRLYPGWTNTQRMTFSVPSIIPTFSGSFGGKMDNTDATSLRYSMPNALVGMRSFTVLCWVYPQDPIGWNNMFFMGRSDSYGYTDWWSGFDFGFDIAITMRMVGNPLAFYDSFAFYYASIQKHWQHFAFRYNYTAGSIAFFRNGGQISISAGSPTPGQFTFHDLNIAYIGYSSRGRNNQVMASVELYLRPLSTAEINSTMIKSKSYGSFQNCNIFT